MTRHPRTDPTAAEIMTAHLDITTAQELAAELMTATVGRTALIVTHRPEQTPGLPQVRLGRHPDSAQRRPVAVTAGGVPTPAPTQDRQT